MDFEFARLVVLYVTVHELLLEALEQREEESGYQNRLLAPKAFKEAKEKFIDECYDELVGSRNLLACILDYTEDEVVHACDNVWESFVSATGN